MLKYNPNLKQSARRLRKEMTLSERTLWSRLRRKQLRGVQFYRQRPIGSYIVDFYAPKSKLVVVDGLHHLGSTHGRTMRSETHIWRAQGCRYSILITSRFCRSLTQLWM